MKHFPRIIGVAGVARSGKDTFYKYLSRVMNRDIERAAFADELKKDLYPFLRDKVDISPFTKDDKEKEIIRPILVAYGCMMRKISKGRYWINKMEEHIKSCKGDVCITDVRFPNETEFIKANSGIVIHLSRRKPSGIIIKPVNQEEAEQNPLLIEASDYSLTWDTFTEDESAYMSFIQKFVHNSGLASLT
jgi:hypothetical protein